MTVRYPAPLRPGDTIGVTSPSAGVPTPLRPRLEVAVRLLREQGFGVVVGGCMSGEGVVSAPAPERAAELMGMLLDPRVRAVVPPWGGELAVEILPHLDLDALARAEPTWVVGYSDITTLLLPLTTAAGWATLHGQNLMDTPYRVPAPLLAWTDVARAAPGARLEQGPSVRHRSGGHDDWQADPQVGEYTFDSAGSWRLLDPGAGDVRVTGRLLGGCLEIAAVVAGTRYADAERFAARHAPEGLIVHVEAAEHSALDVARDLWRLRLTGWFDRATAVLVGRTNAPDDPGFTQEDAVRSALGDLPASGVPVVLDVDCGHVPPHLALVDGALAELTVTTGGARLVQHLA